MAKKKLNNVLTCLNKNFRERKYLKFTLKMKAPDHPLAHNVFWIVDKWISDLWEKEPKRIS